MATIGRGPEREIPHTGTETRTRLLREAAVKYWAMEATLTQPCRVQEDCPMGCKLLLYRKKLIHVWITDGTVRIRTG